MSNLYLTITGRAFEADEAPAAAPRANTGWSLVEPLALPPDWLSTPDVIGLFLSRGDAQPQAPARDGR